jgi:hypothetical protein
MIIRRYEGRHVCVCCWSNGRAKRVPLSTKVVEVRVSYGPGRTDGRK